MATQAPGTRDSFGSKIGAIAAAAGSAVGLGNIWRFPYVAGENGGGAFLMIYVLFIIAIGVPVMLAEFSIGRNAQRNAFGSFKKIAPGTPWYLVGMMGVVTAFMILSFYSTVAGWTLEYLYNALTNSFAGKTPGDINHMFTHFISGTARPIIWQLVFMFLTGWIVIAGVKRGIEKYARILMPLLLLLIIAMAVRAVTLPGASEGVAFLFNPDFSKITPQVVLQALGQAFFSLSVGMGTLITYGSYIRKDDNLVSTAVSVSAADTMIAILAGVAIFPAVFAFGIAPAAGPGLVFQTLPNIFLQMPGGSFFAILFFVLLTVAALTSSISVLEVVVAYFVEELKLNRKKATVLATLSITLVGLFSTMSWGVLKDVHIFGMSVFDFLDFTSSSILLPVGGLFIVLFVGWFMNQAKVRDEVTNQEKFNKGIFPIFRIIVRFVAPIVIALILINKLGLF